MKHQENWAAKTKRVKGSWAAKLIAFVLFVIFACTGIASCICFSYKLNNTMHIPTEQEMLKDAVIEVSCSNADRIVQQYQREGQRAVDADSRQTNARYTVSEDTLENGHFTIRENETNYVITTPVYYGAGYYETGGMDSFDTESGTMGEITCYLVTTTVDKQMEQPDVYAQWANIIHTCYGVFQYSGSIFVVSTLLAIALFVFLLTAAGHRIGRDEIVTGPLFCVPFDLLTVAMLLIWGLGGLSIDGFLDFGFGYQSIWPLFATGGVLVIAGVILTGWCMSLAVRIKLNSLWRKLLCWHIMLLLWRGVKAIWRGVKSVCRDIKMLFVNVPLIWKTAVVVGAVCLFELLFFNIFFFWFIEHLILVPLILFGAIQLKKLQTGGKKLAEGDLSYQVNTKRMYPDFKQHGAHLNSIGLGMNRVVEERMRSERMKTELITNVSHDIKTPLTSIVNYVDLIAAENTENETIREYIAILQRQSERLKKLIEDLVEASKASTGSLEVHKAPVNLGVLLEQTAGEFRERLTAAELEAIVNKPEEDVIVMADGRQLWRVLENLMNNVCKYAQPNTRVYIDCLKQKEQVILSFKNISKYPLNITSEELLERFVRGDKSRSTEGSGLGLSIAKSLMELQDGTLKLRIDGDLFKVILTLPL